MTVYLYGDETEFDFTVGSVFHAYVGSGLLACDAPVTKAVVDEAIHNLQADPDRHKPRHKEKDDRTLQRGYFHASDDSQNAHSHLCRSIVKHVAGTFFYSYFRTNPRHAHDVERFSRGVGAFQELELELAGLGLLERRDKIEAVIERRGSFNDQKAKEWAERFFQVVEQSIFDVPENPTPFPELVASTADKSNPGLQVVDFLLWAMNRKYAKPPREDWFKRLDMTCLRTLHTESRAELAGTFRVGKGATLGEFLYPEGIPMPGYPQSMHEACASYRFVERHLRSISQGNLPAHAAYLHDRLQQITGGLTAAQDAQPQLLSDACSVFLRLFDTVPLYEGIPPDDQARWDEFLRARMLAASVVRRDKVQCVILVNNLVRYRRGAIRKNPAAFNTA